LKILIIGAGETGYFIAHELSEEEMDVVLIDEKPQHLEALQRSLNVGGVVGNGTSLNVLEQAGIETCDYLIACTDHDETNLICCLIATQYKVPYKIAVTRTDSFLKRKLVQRYLDSGVSQIINSSVVTAQEIVATATYASATAVSLFGERNVLLIGYKLKPENPWVGKPMKDIRQNHQGQEFLIASIVRGGASFIPSGQDQLETGDYLYILASKEESEKLDQILNTKIAYNRKAVVAGSGYIAQRVVQGLIHSHFQVTLICDDLAQYHVLKTKFAHFEELTLVHGDAASVKLQLREDVATSALFVAVGKRDQHNIATALVAKYLGASKTIAMVNRQDLVETASLLEIDVILSPRLSTARQVKKAMQGGQADLNFTTISETDMEVREMVVSPNSPFVGIPLKDLTLPKDTLIGAVVDQANQVVIPHGNTVLAVGNRVIVVTMPESAQRLRELFEA